jgi:hypothetical protein
MKEINLPLTKWEIGKLHAFYLKAIKGSRPEFFTEAEWPKVTALGGKLSKALLEAMEKYETAA